VCIVNATNGGLSHGGGVAAAILEAAGPEFDRECTALVRNHGRIPVGQAVLTTAGKLTFEGVIHAIGPRWGDGDEGAKIVSALISAFTLAHDRGWRSLSFPAISAGIFLVPPEVCAKAYLEAVRSFYERCLDSPLRRIRLCLFKGPIVDAVRVRMQDAALDANRSGKATAQ
jgi:putative ATPase